jgi:nicotinamide mononucleotide transporter
MSLLKWFFEYQFVFGTKSIPLREVVGGVLGMTSAILGMRRLVAAWPVGILADGLLVTVFLGGAFGFAKAGEDGYFYGQASRNILLIIVSAYGWARWTERKRKGHPELPAVTPRWTTATEKWILLPWIILFYVVSFQIFQSLGESGPWLWVDAWIFTGTALATFGMSRGYVEFWLAWIAVDLVGVPFAIANGYYPTGILYALYLPFVIWGFISWLRISKSERESLAL